MLLCGPFVNYLQLFALAIYGRAQFKRVVYTFFLELFLPYVQLQEARLFGFVRFLTNNRLVRECLTSC